MVIDIQCATCNEILELPFTDHPLNPDYKDVWTKHGHFPGRITFMCPCGGELANGPIVYPGYQDGKKALMAWWSIHKAHFENGSN